jgi:HlyD family secretion protein
MKRLFQLVAFACLLGLGGAGWSAINRYRQSHSANDIPIAPARKTEFLAIIRCRGDLKASRSAAIYTPFVPNLRIAWLAQAGELIEKGSPIIRFDSSSAEQQLIQKEAQLRQAQATLDQAIAQARITAQKDETDLGDARYNVEKARLDTTGNEFVGRLQAEQTKIDLGVAEQKLRAQEATVALHEASDKSKIASLTRQRDQAQAEVELMEIKAPLTGYLMMNSNYNQGPLNAKPFKVGDNVFSGMSLGEMPDLSTIEMDAKVEEMDRGRVGVGNDVRLRIDALPELNIQARITSISPLAELGIEFPPTRSFRAYARIANPDPRLRTGMNGGMDIIINRLPDAISIPAKALFTRAGKPVVFIADRGRYTPSEVRILARNPDEIAIAGVPEGAMVAMSDPEKRDAKK